MSNAKLFVKRLFAEYHHDVQTTGYWSKEYTDDKILSAMFYAYSSAIEQHMEECFPAIEYSGSLFEHMSCEFSRGFCTSLITDCSNDDLVIYNAFRGSKIFWEVFKRECDKFEKTLKGKVN